MNHQSPTCRPFDGLPYEVEITATGAGGTSDFRIGWGVAVAVDESTAISDARDVTGLAAVLAGLGLPHRYGMSLIALLAVMLEHVSFSPADPQPSEELLRAADDTASTPAVVLATDVVKAIGPGRCWLAPWLHELVTELALSGDVRVQQKGRPTEMPWVERSTP